MGFRAELEGHEVAAWWWEDGMMWGQPFLEILLFLFPDDVMDISR